MKERTGSDDPGEYDEFARKRSLAGVDRVGILVRDIAVARSFHGEQVGTRLVAEEALGEGGARLAFLAAGNTLIHRVQPARPGPLTAELDAPGESIPEGLEGWGSPTWMTCSALAKGARS